MGLGLLDDVRPSFSMRFVGELHSRKKKGNERQEPEIDGFGILETVLSTTRIVWCLCLFRRVYILTMYNPHF